ncbi:MAG: c-type cytochrome [Pseudomonadota bacterium]
MKLSILLAAVAAPLLCPSAHASLALAQKNNCLACHGVDHKIVGPAYQDIAKRYAGQADAQAKLVASIKAGGAGKWGAIPMPAQAQLADADAQALATWILGGAK